MRVVGNRMYPCSLERKNQMKVKGQKIKKLKRGKGWLSEHLYCHWLRDK